MDAVPLTLGQEFCGYVAQLDYGLAAHRGDAAGALRARPRRHGRRHRAERATRSSRERVAKQIAELTGLPFVTRAEQVRRRSPAHEPLVFAQRGAQDARRARS